VDDICEIRATGIMTARVARVNAEFGWYDSR